ncbi:tetratricopeptide repeat protein [Marinifilum sp. D737]|uniref:tetratricopeptide repeat protein n=1 Tax=Marinifilum sp. D737 TaxID=2969628 RepID=UPI0022770830|nr:hypothetical protein [Marinifilum sp. D737]MCY1633347.1 hypothetical protein [Marinifilum sp. D737]
MKKNVLRLLVISVVFLFPFVLQASSEINKGDSILENIQNKIYTAFMNSFEEGNTNDLMEIENELIKIKTNDQITSYWIAYSKYYESIFYLKMRNKKSAKKVINEAIEIVELIDNKNSESYALLANLYSFSTQFADGMLIGTISQKVKNNAEKAIKLDEENLRAWYVLGSNDFYTPEIYGGGKKCEELLLKSISLNEQKIKNSYMPSWGKNDAFSLLVAYYIRKEDYPKAIEYLDKALILYPNDYMLNQYAKQLKK